ncbi:MAG: 30S ribosomal protein S13 [Nitrospirales bacterium]|nr:30S ribosomal protein S13 [Nitrospira sp.]MDR4500366.1 30S ribosomal protein S13 [Nitrospirales bacterium]
MARIAGVDLPVGKRIDIGLRYIYGIGPVRARDILRKTGVSGETRVKDLQEEDIVKLREVIDQDYNVEGDLRKEITMSIKRLMDAGAYRGLRHRRGLPVRGQRSKTNARTRKGKRAAIGGKGRK